MKVEDKMLRQRLEPKTVDLVLMFLTVIFIEFSKTTSAESNVD